MPEDRDVTQVLIGIASEEIPASQGLARIYPVVYEELRGLAASILGRRRPNQTLSATALVHEAYLRLVNQSVVRSKSRCQFFGVAAKAMRSVLVDHARRRLAQKRGGGWQRITWSGEIAAPESVSLELLDLHRALDDLSAKDERMAQVVEMRVFAGLTVAETADALGVAARTVDTDWKVAKAWLSDRMAGPGPS